MKMRNQLFSLMLGVVLMTAWTGNATAQSRTPWEMHKGLESGPFAAPYNDIVLWGYTMPSHGNVAEYNYAAAIPESFDAGWGPAPNGDTIGFSIYSRLCGRVACRQGGDFTYFQTFVNVPENVVVTAFTIAFSGMDDGSRISIINSLYPNGLVIPGSYVFLGGSGTTNLAPYVASGELNRVVITQVDDCCSGNNLHSAKVVLNGNTVITNPDSDGDGVPDSDDTCPGFDDNVDADADGIADGCDACPADFYGDSDGDGSCDSDDPCFLDAQDDIDQDGICADQDICPLDSENDADQDGVCGDQDVCPYDVANDADGDGICGNLDACPGGDDNADSDGDGTADFCDICPLDAANDADADGLCADEDICPLDVANDADADGLCADEDICPLDADNDVDQDGVCGDVDPCPADFENDADGDGICESEDNCPAVANANQSNVDGDEFGDACEPDNDDDGVVDDYDNCAMDANADQADFDGDGFGDICDLDSDGDGVTDGEDVCLATALGEPVLYNGCSVAQECVCDAAWKNHGSYVSCVAHACNALVASGLITGEEHGVIVSAAAHSECGVKTKGKK
jgi:hypothetical protein